MDRIELGRSLNLKEELVAEGRPNRTGRSMAPTFITIHNTSNSGSRADAEAHSRFIRNTGFYVLADGTKNYVSWHYTVDDVCVIKHLPINERGIHAGRGNAVSIAIEVCMHREIDQQAANQRAARLVAALLHDLGLGADRVVTHKHWTDKVCPVVLLPAFDQFVEMADSIRRSVRGSTETASPDGFVVMSQHESRAIAAAAARRTEEAPGPYDDGDMDHDAMEAIISSEALSFARQRRAIPTVVRSVRKPPASSGAESTAAPPEKLTTGSDAGTRVDGTSPAARRFLVFGKSGPLERPERRAHAALESVIGDDERVRIRETGQLPWRMLAALRIEAPYGTFVGTGWFAGPRTLITAGHCVFDLAQMGGWADSIAISPGRDGDELPFGTVTATRFSTLDRWIEYQDPDFDIAAIHLDEPLGRETGWFAVGSYPAAELENRLVNVSGYPGTPGNGREQWFHANRVQHVSERRLYYDVDTTGGQSGAPVFIYEEEDKPPTVVAIHAYGVGGTSQTLGIVANSAPLIIPEVFARIKEWIGDSTA